MYFPVPHWKEWAQVLIENTVTKAYLKLGSLYESMKIQIDLVWTFFLKLIQKEILYS